MASLSSHRVSLPSNNSRALGMASAAVMNSYGASDTKPTISLPPLPFRYSSTRNLNFMAALFLSPNTGGSSLSTAPASTETMRTLATTSASMILSSMLVWPEYVRGYEAVDAYPVVSGSTISSDSTVSPQPAAIARHQSSSATSSFRSSMTCASPHSPRTCPEYSFIR